MLGHSDILLIRTFRYQSVFFFFTSALFVDFVSSVYEHATFLFLILFLNICSRYLIHGCFPYNYDVLPK